MTTLSPSNYSQGQSTNMKPLTATSRPTTTVVEPPKRRTKASAAVISPRVNDNPATATKQSATGNRSSSSSLSSSSSAMDPRFKVDQGIVDELLLVCGVIGTTTSDDQQTLVPVTDCLNWLQDLQRALRRDDDNYRPISLLIGKWKVVQQKLLPLVMSCRYDTPIVLTIVKILVILTKPLSETAKRAGTMVIDTKSRKAHPSVVKQQIKLRENALEQSQMLMEYKRAITHHSSHLAEHQRQTGGKGGLLSIFVSLLAEPLSKSGTGRSDSDHLTIELVLHLLRNLLCAEPLLNVSSLAAQQSIQLHQELITLLDKELVLEIILVVGQEMELRENSPYNLLMMEILHHLLRSQDPTAVARSFHTQRDRTNAAAAAALESGGQQSLKKAGVPIATGTSGALRSQLQKEKKRMQGALTSRHSNFGGTLVVNRPDGKRQMQSAALVERMGAGSSASTHVIQRKNRKTEPFVASNTILTSHTRRAVAPNDSMGPAAQEAQKTLHGFCKRFLEKCYGPVMKSLKNEFRRDSVRLENDDRVIFFRIVWFFSQWWRVSWAGDRQRQTTKSVESDAVGGSDDSNGELGQLIFTMDIFTFNLVLNATDTFFQYKQYTQLAQAVALYCEMMHLLYRMYQSKETTEQIMALGLMDRLFYTSEPLDRLPKLLSKWSPSTNTRDYLCDLVELCHVTLKLLESNSKESLDNELQKGSKAKADAVAKMKENAADFDVTVYLSRKIISAQVVGAYTYLLRHYSVNAPHINHHVVAFFLRLSKFKIATNQDDAERDGMGIPKNLLATKTVTLEPMMYNINMIMVLNTVLNDTTIRNDADFASLLTFAVGFMHNFYQSCQTNPLLYVECLFRHVAPHRFCDLSTNMYVSEELRMIAERELLLEETRRFESREGTEDAIANDDEDEPELEFLDDERGGIVAAPRRLASHFSTIDEAQNEGNNSEAANILAISSASNKKRSVSGNLTTNDTKHTPKKIARFIDDSSDDEDQNSPTDEKSLAPSAEPTTP